MIQSNPVFRLHMKQFKKEKGMMVFYSLSIIIVGIMIPLFYEKVESSLTIAAFLTAVFLRPLLSDSVAGEREHRTLETLLSSPINAKCMIAGKFQFYFLFAVSFFLITALCAGITRFLVADESTLKAWQWICMIILSLLAFGAISIAGIYISSKAKNMQVANHRISFLAYPLVLLFVIYMNIVASNDFLSALVIGFVDTLIYLSVIFIYTIKVLRMKQSDYFENLYFKKLERKYNNHVSFAMSKSQFGTVLRFELKYLLTLRTLLLNFVFLCFGPIGMVCLLFYVTGTLDLNYAVIITVLMIPRVPTNLIAYSIGGEKVYKTGESLLSTPLTIKSIFLGKCMIPILVSAIMLIISSLLTLLGVKIAALVIPKIPATQGYTLEQFILLIPVSILSSIAIMFIAAILSVILKTPRHGLYATSLLSFLFAIPVLAIIYMTANTLMWSLLYLGVLFSCDVLCLMRVSDKISRPQIMSRL